MGITPDTVERLARLSCLSLTERERESMAAELEELVDCMKVLTALDGGEGAATPAAPDGLREDLPIPSMDRAELLASAPAHDGESYLVPRTVG